MTKRYLCIHGHFYQPPRENPWIGIIEGQPTARPFHDWNERITRECYAPNLKSRLLTGDGRIIRLIDNYRHLSFNFGPTLLSWMEKSAPETYQGILDADKAAREARGRGRAMAQVYNHVIMPLADQRDRLTQIRWGLADFAHRFGRPAEGMWLAETAVDAATLEMLAREGVRFTILAPHQAAAVRPLPEKGGGEQPWQKIDGHAVDPRRAYRVFPADDRKLFIDVIFYDGPTSRAIAFERLLSSGENFLARIEQAFGQDNGEARLVTLATDGESYGHHFRFGDMALAWVFDQLERRDDIACVGPAEFLDLHPPTWEARVVNESSWSCAHGVERWRSDCGCNVGNHEGWNQKWRTPLRQGLDWLKARLDAIFEERGGGLLADPWAARDDYVRVLLSSDNETCNDFIARHQKGESVGTGAARRLDPDGVSTNGPVHVHFLRLVLRRHFRSGTGAGPQICLPRHGTGFRLGQGRPGSRAAGVPGPGQEQSAGIR